MKPIIILYVPVLHQGYIRFFEKYKNKVEEIWILDEDLIKEFTYLEPEIRTIQPKTMTRLVEALEIFPRVSLLNKSSIEKIRQKEIITANEQISIRLIEKYLPNNKTTLDTIFLRWDEASVNSSVLPTSSSSIATDFDKEMIKKAGIIANLSSDWWRQVGAVVVKDGKIILETHNQHVPNEQMPYIEGDPRDFIEAGKLSQFSTALHCEQTLISEAARQGISLEGTDIYVTVFPCPVCAKLVAYSGIKRCFFSTGHASLDSERILSSKNVEIIQV